MWPVLPGNLAAPKVRPGARYRCWCSICWTATDSMTGIDFYVLPSDSLQRRLEFACQLTETAVNAGHRVLLAVDDQDSAEQLDQLLWTLKPESFLPHRVITATADAQPALNIEITADDTSFDHHDVLIAMRAEI